MSIFNNFSIEKCSLVLLTFNINGSKLFSDVCCDKPCKLYVSVVFADVWCNKINYWRTMLFNKICRAVKQGLLYMLGVSKFIVYVIASFVGYKETRHSSTDFLRKLRENKLYSGNIGIVRHLVLLFDVYY